MTIPRLPTLQMIYKQDGQLLFPRRVPVVTTLSPPTLQMIYKLTMGP
jgi:hypothetical protein